ncbi:MAG TPA: hypothetical protein DHV36_22600, partial [Desulfobacteraceae bacterium]|nr:hypothetical protein [Desulfobacteraceae bacterium]
MKFRLSLGRKLFIFLTLTTFVIFSLLFLLAESALQDFGKVAVELNTQQIKHLSETYLMDIAREKTRKLSEKMQRYEAGAIFIAAKAGQIYGGKNHWKETQSTPVLTRNPENHIFYTPRTRPCITLYWGSHHMPEDSQKELNRLFSLDDTLAAAKQLTGQSLAAHIITLSGIGKYYTGNPDARDACFKLPSPSEFDLRHGEPITIHTRHAGDYGPKMTPPYKDDVIEGFMVTATAPILDRNGILIGIAGIDVPLSQISAYLTADNNPHRHSILIGPKGVIMAYSRNATAFLGLRVDESRFKNSDDVLNLTLQDTKRPEIKEIARNIMDTRDGFFRLTVDDTTYLLAAANFPDSGMVLLEAMDESYAMTSVRQTRAALKSGRTKTKYNFIIYAAAFFVICLICIAEAVRHVVRPIRQLTAFTGKIAKKEYHHRITLNRSDEIGELSSALDLMARRLKQFKTQEKAYIEDLSKRSEQLKKMNEYLVYFEESEREDIASKLHSTIAQSLGIGMSKVGSMIGRPEQISRDDLEQLHRFLEQAVKEIRTIMYDLAPPILNDFDIDVAIEFLLEEINRNHGTEFRFYNYTQSPVPLNKALKLTFYRAVKTLLSGICDQNQEAGVQVELSSEDTQLLIRITVDGNDIDTEALLHLPAGRSGHTLGERMERLGGGMTTTRI